VFVALHQPWHVLRQNPYSLFRILIAKPCRYLNQQNGKDLQLIAKVGASYVSEQYFPLSSKDASVTKAGTTQATAEWFQQ
jgi:hypothetical protein